ncbi:hypothetical protein C2W64_04335 [Brevibacillus laterosporus]|nr:hypothetical protein C2W64_04335 [Brevibacillus laterosporus]
MSSFLIPLLDRNQLTVIDLGDEAEFEQIFWNLLQSKTPLFATDKDDLSFLYTRISGFG